MPEPDQEHRADLELLTVADVCTLFQVTKDCVYDEVEAGRLRYVRLGRKHLRFRRLDLASFLSRPEMDRRS
ncbi:MAG: helix-turn-helix domain-containing protein [Kineosporiaceae bacterium]|nr:helix-turn-helix domain-containing protein [Kineosporiaceae bacterium]